MCMPSGQHSLNPSMYRYDFSLDVLHQSAVFCVEYILIVLYMKYFLKRLCVKLKCVYFPTDLHCEFQRSSLKKDWP